MLIRKNRKKVLTSAAILSGTVTTSVHADEFTDLYNKVQAFNSRIDTELSADVVLGETVNVPVASIADMGRQVDQHITSTDSALANKGDIAAELEAYNARKNAYNAERDAAIRYNKENAGLEIVESGGKTLLKATGTNYQKIDITQIFTPTNTEKLADFFNGPPTIPGVPTSVAGQNQGQSFRLSGPQGVDALVTWTSGIVAPIDLDRHREKYNHAFSLNAESMPLAIQNGPATPTEMRFQFVKSGTNEPVNVATMFRTVDFDNSERLAIKSDTGTSAMVSGVRDVAESGEWDVYNGGFAPTDTVGESGSVTAFTGSDISIKFWNEVAILGLFAPVPDFNLEVNELRPVPPVFSEPAPTSKTVTVQKLALPERIVTTQPIPIKTKYVDNPNELPGYEVVKQEGKAGVLTITKMNGVSDGGVVTTPMQERIIERGTMVRVITSEPIPVTTRFIDNPDELPGYEVVREKGRAGVLTITTDNGVSNGGVVTRPMVERVVERGTGVDIVEPVKVEYKPVDDIPYGEQKVIVEGRARVTRNNKERVSGITRIVEIGTTKTEYTQTGTVVTRYIPDADTPYGETREFTKGYRGLTTVETRASVDANGKIVNPVSETTVEDKQDHIIAVGNVKKDPITIPFETQYIDDPTLKEGEEVVEVKGEVGTGYLVTGHVINPETGELGESQTSTTVTTRPVNALIRRGTKVETPVTDTPIVEKPTETPVAEKPVTETPVSEKPVTETPVTEKPVTETPTSEKPVTETPTTEKPVTETPVTEKPVTETPATEKPVTETPTSEKPVTETPTSEKPVTETPTTEKPVTETPTSEKPVTETPTTEKPVTETPVTEKPVTEKPVTETPTTEKPVTNTSTTGTSNALTKPTLQTATQPTNQTAAVKTTQPLPKTGDTSGLSTIVGLVSTITSGLGLTLKRRNKTNK